MQVEGMETDVQVGNGNAVEERRPAAAGAVAMTQGVTGRPARRSEAGFDRTGMTAEEIIEKRLSEPAQRLGFTQVVHLRRAGQEAAIQMFNIRRQRDAQRSVLTPYGAGLEYASFLPTHFFSRFVGNLMFSLNDVLEQRKEQDAEDMMRGLFNVLTAHHRELLQRVDASRERLARIIDFCDHAFEEEYAGILQDGLLKAAWLTVEEREETGLSGSDEGFHDGDPYKERRDNLLETGVLSPLAAEQGYVAFRPTTFFGRYLGELCYAFNDALRRFERNTSYQLTLGDERLGVVYLRLEESVRIVAEDLTNVRGIARRKL